MTKLANGINAWIYLDEDEPPNTTYNNPDSCYQSLIHSRVYDSATFLGIAFFKVIPATQGSTIQIGDKSHTVSSSESLSNQDYLNFVLRDARQVNPGIKFLATMVYSGDSTLASIFSKDGDPQTQATDFANNLIDYLKESGMNGLDIDWEGPVSEQLSPANFQILFSTIRKVFDQQTVKYYLSFTPAWSRGAIDYSTLDGLFDFVSPQLYDGTSLESFLKAKVPPALIGYGAQFEPGNSAPNTSAQQVWSAVSEGFPFNNTQYDYQDIFMWRLNSGNFQFEQAQFMILDQLGNPPTGKAFDDTLILSAAGNPNLTQMTIRSGDVLDAIQATNTGTGPYNFGTEPGTKTGTFTLLQHGGNGGSAQTITIPLDDPIVSVSGHTGVWYGWQCVLQLTLTGKSGTTYGPFGSMAGAGSRNPFVQEAPAGQSVVGFSGTTVTVPLAGDRLTAIIATLNAVFA
jgi:hypothetical protein